MAKSKNQRTAAPVNKQTTEPSAPAPAADPTAATTPTAPNTNPANEPTVVPPADDSQAPVAPEGGAAAQAPVNDDPTPPADDQSGSQEPEKIEVKESMKRPELDAVAVEEGLTNASKYKDKAAVVAAVERVRAGEVASDVDTELTPVAPVTGADVEVEAAGPFFDLIAKATRKTGDKFKVTETRAAELRGHKLIK